MTDTTISPEERALWRKNCERKLAHDMARFVLPDPDDMRILRLLTALEAAEARADKAEALLAEAKKSARECEEGWTSHCLEQTREAPLTKQGRAAWWATIENSVQHGNAVGCACMMDMHATDVQRFLELIEAAEAESARLRAERDWLAGYLAEGGCPYLAFWADFEGGMRPDWCICTDTPDDGFDCTGNPKECWQKKAAIRAVADSEVGE